MTGAEAVEIVGLPATVAQLYERVALLTAILSDMDATDVEILGVIMRLQDRLDVVEAKIAR